MGDAGDAEDPDDPGTAFVLKFIESCWFGCGQFDAKL
jgi:hypothetical protein